MFTLTAKLPKAILTGLRPLIFSSFLALIISSASYGQLDRDIQLAGELVNDSQPKIDSERAKVFEQIIHRLRPYKNEDPDVRMLTSVLAHQSDWLGIDPYSLAENVERALTTGGRAERLRSLKFARIDLLDRMSHFLLARADRKMTGQDAQKVLDFARSVSQAWNDLSDPSILGGKASEATRIFARLNGIANLALSVSDPEARRILSNLRGLLGIWSVKLRRLDVAIPNPIRVFETPAEVLGAVMDTTNKGWNQSTDCLIDISLAITGDEAALRRLPAHANRIGATLSREKYDRAMLGAFSNSLISRMPFVRTIVNWFGSTPSGNATKTDALELEEAPGKVNWDSAADFVRHFYRSGRENIMPVYCPPNPMRQYPKWMIWGSEYYKVGSAICPAAVHAGVLTFESGGVVVLEFVGIKFNAIPGTTSHGVTSEPYSNWGTFRFKKTSKS